MNLGGSGSSNSRLQHTVESGAYDPNPLPAGAGTGFDNPGSRPTGSSGTAWPTTGGYTSPYQVSMSGTGVSPAGLAEQRWFNDSFWNDPTKLSGYADNNPNITNMGAGADVTLNAANAAMAAPNQSSNYFQSVVNGGMPSNYSELAALAFAGSTPANMDPFYDRAMERATADINRGTAARGMFGSSTAVNAIEQSSADLRAQQARDNAQYGLDRASLAGQLARGADDVSLARVMGVGELAGQADENVLDKYKIAGELGLGYEGAEQSQEELAAQIFRDVDQGELDKERSASDIALRIDDLTTRREAQMFDQIFGTGNAFATIAQNGFENMTDTDLSLLQTAMSGDIAGAKAALDAARQRGETVRADIAMFIDGASTVSTMGMNNAIGGYYKGMTPGAGG